MGLLTVDWNRGAWDASVVRCRKSRVGGDLVVRQRCRNIVRVAIDRKREWFTANHFVWPKH